MTWRKAEAKACPADYPNLPKVAVAAPVFFSLSLLFYGLIVAVCFRASVFSGSKSQSHEVGDALMVMSLMTHRDAV